MNGQSATSAPGTLAGRVYFARSGATLNVNTYFSKRKDGTILKIIDGWIQVIRSMIIITYWVGKIRVYVGHATSAASIASGAVP